MGKARRSDKEYSREQKLAHENQALKRHVSSLRKQLARLDLDRYSQLKETIEQYYQEDRHQEGQDILDKARQEWACREANCLGFLEIIVFTKMGEPWYYRACNCCFHRTKSQKHTKDVKGIIKETKHD